MVPYGYMYYDCIPEFTNSTRWFDDIKLGSAKLWDGERLEPMYEYWRKYHEGEVEEDAEIHVSDSIKYNFGYEWISTYESPSYVMPGLPFDEIIKYLNANEFEGF